MPLLLARRSIDTVQDFPKIGIESFRPANHWRTFRVDFRGEDLVDKSRASYLREIESYYECVRLLAGPGGIVGSAPI